MRIPLFTLLFAAAPLYAAEPYLTYDNKPLGTMSAPLVMQTYLPDPDLDPAIFVNHGKGVAARKYSPITGRDIEGEIPPIKGVPAGVAVSFGPALAYVFDAVECRPLYAWQGGFLDFASYWGDEKRGSRVARDYVPRLMGTLFYKAEGAHPLSINGRKVADFGSPVYVGYQLTKGVPTFEFRAGEYTLKTTITPSKDTLSFQEEWTCSPAADLVWEEGAIKASGKGSLAYTLSGKNLGQFQGYKVKIDLTKPNVEAGGTLFSNYGCIGCHSTDGGNGHGPTVAGLAGSKVAIEGKAESVIADEAFLLESITDPNAKITKGYPPNYMPPFKIPDAEAKSLVLFIQSLGKPE